VWVYPSSLTKRTRPPLLQGILQRSPHGWADVSVDAVHSWHLVAHTFGFQDLRYAVLVHPGLEAVSQAVRGQPVHH
jgi:hypothetical protein